MKLYAAALLITFLTACKGPSSQDSNKVKIEDIKATLYVSAMRRTEPEHPTPSDYQKLKLVLEDKFGKPIKIDSTKGEDHLSVYLDSTLIDMREAICSESPTDFCGYILLTYIDYIIGQHQLRAELTRNGKLEAAVQFELPGAADFISPSPAFGPIKASDLPLIVEWDDSYHPTHATLFASNTQCGGKKEITLTNSQTYVELNLDELAPSDKLCDQYSLLNFSIYESTTISPSVITGFTTGAAYWDIQNVLGFEITH